MAKSLLAYHAIQGRITLSFSFIPFILRQILPECLTIYNSSLNLTLRMISIVNQKG